jgi:hypothetical protein
MKSKPTAATAAAAWEERSKSSGSQPRKSRSADSSAEGIDGTVRKLNIPLQSTRYILSCASANRRSPEVRWRKVGKTCLMDGLSVPWGCPSCPRPSCWAVYTASARRIITTTECSYCEAAEEGPGISKFNINLTYHGIIMINLHNIDGDSLIELQALSLVPLATTIGGIENA